MGSTSELGTRPLPSSALRIPEVMISVPFAWRRPQQKWPQLVAGAKAYDALLLPRASHLTRIGSSAPRYPLRARPSQFSLGGRARRGRRPDRLRSAVRRPPARCFIDRLFHYPKVGFAFVASTISSFQWWSRVRARSRPPRSQELGASLSSSFNFCPPKVSTFVGLFVTSASH
jgi:hypothetical protein